MRLQYRLLWIDDKIDDYVRDGDVGEIASFISELGFEPQIHICRSSSELNEIIEKEKFDLIVSDYNLEDSGEKDDHYGDKVIEQIRQKKIITEVLLYSSIAENVLSKLPFVDRVSRHAGRKNLIEKIISLIEITLSKIHEPNNLRGLMMAETSDLDETMKEIILLFNKAEIDPTKKEKLLKELCKKISASISGNNNQISRLCEKADSDGLINHPAFDASKKARVLEDIIKLLNLRDFDDVPFFDQYQNEIISTRNMLGHVKEKKNDKGNVIFESHIEGKVFEFSIDNCKKIRLDIKKHRGYLSNIKTGVSRYINPNG
jgi:CheY-like chemotaxis protein